jgi:hypothetical protein
MNQDEWIAYGVEQGFCGPPVCYTHDGLPTTFEEDENWDEDDLCVHIIRPYYDATERHAIELNHSPSKWRKNG